MKLRLVLPLLGLACGCPGRAKYPQPGALTADSLAADLTAAQARATSFKAETTMDYWLGKDRFKGTVLVMGTAGAKVRLNALSPAGGDVLADLGCDGTDFTLVDKQHNCVLTGPCNAASIARFLRVPLDPDDFLHLATGTTPVLPDGTRTLTWHADTGHATLDVKGPGGSQTIEVDARDGHADVVSSTMRGSDGKPLWTLENRDFTAAKDAAGVDVRVPGKSRFQSPGEKADLLVEWESNTINPELADAKFVVPVPPGLPECGAAAPAPNP
jgi:hypothetical protein